MAAMPWMIWNGARHDGDPRTFALPAAGGLLAMWIGFQLDDPAAATIDPAPVTLLERRAVRLSLTVPVATSLWCALVIDARGGTLWLSLSLAFAAEVAVALAGAAVAIAALGNGRGGAGALVALFVVFLLIPAALGAPFALFEGTGSWALYGRALAIGAAAVGVCVLATDLPNLGRIRQRFRVPGTPTDSANA
jgi:hypothetical protein